MPSRYPGDLRETSYEETYDYVPTPPWATRAFLDVSGLDLTDKSVIEPCTGGGHMASVLRERGVSPWCQDFKDFGYPLNLIEDFTNSSHSDGAFDWAITNPPFALSSSIFKEMYRVASEGVVLHVSVRFLSGVGRWNQIFEPCPPTMLVVHSKNVPATQGKVIRRGSNQIQHCWIIWDKRWPTVQDAVFRMIPADSQDKYERPEDYQ